MHVSQFVGHSLRAAAPASRDDQDEQPLKAKPDLYYLGGKITNLASAGHEGAGRSGTLRPSSRRETVYSMLKPCLWTTTACLPTLKRPKRSFLLSSRMHIFEWNDLFRSMWNTPNIMIGRQAKGVKFSYGNNRYLGSREYGAVEWTIYCRSTN